MALKKKSLKHTIPAALFLLILAPFMWAQNETRLVRLAWIADEYALRYEVIIEREDSTGYQHVLSEFTGNSFVELSLELGSYRCRVIPYDFLEKPGQGSQWISFQVRTAIASVPETDKGDISVDYTVPETVTQPEPAAPTAYNGLPPAKAFNIYLTAAWMPMLPIYEEENEFILFEGENQFNFFEKETRFIGRSPSLAGAAVRLGALYSKLSFLNVGLELTGSWYSISATHAATATLNLLAQKQLPNEVMALNYRLGAGLSFMTNKLTLHTNLGLSFLWFFNTHFFLETGLDYTHLFTSGPSGCFRPWLGIGWQF